MPSLQPHHTFGIDVSARELIEFESIADLDRLREAGTFESEHLVLGGGSNVLFRGDFKGSIVLNRMTGIEALDALDERIHLVIQGGTPWHEAVTFAVNQGWGGIENMALIPGSTGAAPMQNIGAYGREIKDCFVSLKAYEKSTGEIRTFDGAACNFGYRESIFKREWAGRFIIIEVTLELSKHPELNTSYGAIDGQLQAMGVATPQVRDVYDAVIAIRTSKLPDPAKLGNAGSFFKNPVITKNQYDAILRTHPQAPCYPQPDGRVKVPAGWLIDVSGWKGHREERCGVHEKQALVLVNYGGATGDEVYQLAQAIQTDIFNRFQIQLEMEVNIIATA